MDTEEIVQRMIIKSSLDMEKIDTLFPILKSYDDSLKLAKLTGKIICTTLSLGLLGGGIAMFVKGLKNNDFISANMLFLSCVGVNMIGSTILRNCQQTEEKSLKRGYKRYKKLVKKLGQEPISEQGYEEAVNDYKNLTLSDILTKGDSFPIGEIGNFSQFELMFMHSQVDFANKLGDADSILEEIEEMERDQEMYDVFGEDFLKPNNERLEAPDDRLNI